MWVATKTKDSFPNPKKELPHFVFLISVILQNIFTVTPRVQSQYLAD